MLLDFNDMKEMTAPGMNNGTGTMIAKMYMDEQGKNHSLCYSCWRIYRVA